MEHAGRSPELFLMSYPRWDWAIRGGANFKSQQTHATRPSPRAALQNWLDIADAITRAGGHVLVMPPSPDRNLTGLPYTAEAGLFTRTPDGAPAFLLPRLTPPHRRDEALVVSGFVHALGWSVRSPQARWEAQGDALRLDDRRMIHTSGHGPMARTEAEAYPELADALTPHHLHLRFIAEPWFHGNTLLAIFWDARTHQPALLVCAEALAPGELERLRAFAPDALLLPITREASLGYATNALQVGRTVIAPAGLPREILAFWERLGLQTVELELHELFHRGGGAAVCLTNRLWGLRLDEVPPHLRYTHQREHLHDLLTTWPEELSA